MAPRIRGNPDMLRVCPTWRARERGSRVRLCERTSVESTSDPNLQSVTILEPRRLGPREALGVQCVLAEEILAIERSASRQ